MIAKAVCLKGFVVCKDEMTVAYSKEEQINSAVKLAKKSPMAIKPWGVIYGAGHEIRTRDFDLGKVALYH